MSGNMDVDYEINCTVEEVSSELFVVSARIDGETRFLWCERDKFFDQGVPFKGQLDDILEEFMNIAAVVRSNNSGEYRVLAAWAGDKPEILEVEDKLMRAVYRQEGILRFTDGNLMITSVQSSHKVLAKREVIYFDGYLLEVGAEDLTDQSVFYDAYPLKCKDPTGALFTATCVWIGQNEPRIVDRFRLHAAPVDNLPRIKTEKCHSDEEEEILESPVRNVILVEAESESDDDCRVLGVIQKHSFAPGRMQVCQRKKENSIVFEKYGVGTVSVIPNEVLAVVDVSIDYVEIKVMLFRRSLDQECDNIRDVLSVGDKLRMLLRSANIFHDTNCWLVVKASKEFSDPERLAEKLLPVEKAVKTGRVKQIVREFVPLVPRDTEDVKSVVRHSALLKTDEKETASTSADAEKGVVTETPLCMKIETNDDNAQKVLPVKSKELQPLIIRPLMKSICPTELILNGTGRLQKFGQFFVAVMKLIPVRVLIHQETFYINGIQSCSDSINGQVGNDICFDAMVLKKRNHLSSATHRSLLSWRGDKPPPQTVSKDTGIFLTSASNSAFRSDIVYVGFVMNVLLPDFCIVQLGAMPVLVPAKSLYVDPWTKDTSPPVITDYLKFGDNVAMTCKMVDNCVVAEMCGTLTSFDSLFGAAGTFDSNSLSIATNNINVSEDHAEKQLIHILQCLSTCLKERVAYRGIVVDFPYRNYAIAVVGDIRVLIHVNNIVVVREDLSNRDYDCIGKHLSIGSTVLLWVERKSVVSFVLKYYYFAREVRVIYENSLKNKIVLKNYKGVIDSVIKNNQFIISLYCGIGFHRIVSDIHLCRVTGNKEIIGSAVLDKIKFLARPSSLVKVNIALNKDDEVVHSVWLP